MCLVCLGVPGPGGGLLTGVAWCQGGVPGPGGVCSQGGAWSWGVCPGGMPGPWGGLLWGVGIPACTEADPPGERQLLLRTVRILLECILVHFYFHHQAQCIYLISCKLHTFFLCVSFPLADSMGYIVQKHIQGHLPCPEQRRK